MEKHEQYTKRLLELIKQNPDLRVFPLVEWEVCGGDEHTYWSGVFRSSEVDEIYMDEERVWIRSQDEEELVNKILDSSLLLEQTYIPLPGVTDEMRAKKIINEYQWEKVIVVYIGT